MASAAEQLAANLNFGAFAKAKELQKRLLFTFAALIIYRLGTYIPLPGIDTAVIAEVFEQQSNGILGMFNMFSGGALGRMTIFALNIMPYISSAIIIQLGTAVLPSLAQLKKEGEAGRKKINQYTRYGTVLLAAVQAYGIAVGLEGFQGQTGGAVLEPGMFFRLTTVVTLTGGTIFLMWLGEQITARGVGNGISLIIFSGIVAELPRALVNTLELGRTGVLSGGILIVLIAMALGVIAFIVFIERSQRRIIVQYPKRQVGQRMFGGESSHLPLKLNTAGVIPPIFASSILLLPITAISMNSGQGPGWLSDVASVMGRGQPAYMLLYTAAIIFFTFLLHLGRLQSHRHCRQSQKEWRLRSGHPAGQEYGGLPRLCADALDGGRCALSDCGLPAARDADFTICRAVLFRRHQPVDRCDRDHGYGRPDSIAFAGASI